MLISNFSLWNLTKRRESGWFFFSFNSNKTCKWKYGPWQNSQVVISRGFIHHLSNVKSLFLHTVSEMMQEHCEAHVWCTKQKESSGSRQFFPPVLVSSGLRVITTRGPQRKLSPCLGRCDKLTFDLDDREIYRGEDPLCTDVSQLRGVSRQLDSKKSDCKAAKLVSVYRIHIGSL